MPFLSKVYSFIADETDGRASPLQPARIGRPLTLPRARSSCHLKRTRPQSRRDWAECATAAITDPQPGPVFAFWGGLAIWIGIGYTRKQGRRSL
jgi:hypothetical protein